MPRGKRAGSKMPTADYDAGCRVRSTSTKCPTRKSRTSSLPPISRPENAWASRLLFRQSSKSLAKTCKSGSHKALLHLALESRLPKQQSSFDEAVECRIEFRLRLVHHRSQQGVGELPTDYCPDLGHLLGRA